MRRLIRSRRPPAPCKACGAAAKHLRAIPNEHPGPARLDVHLCRDCGLLFVGTPLDPADLAEAYDTAANDYYYDQIATGTAAKAVAAVDDLAPLLASTSGRVLDVGCGFGHLLEVIAERFPGTTVEGLELPGVGAEASVAKGFRVHTSIEQVEGPYALATLLDVAEHLVDPRATFAACSRLVGPDGHVYGHTPRRTRWDSLFLVMARLPVLDRVAWLWLQSRVSVFHLQLWSDRSLRMVLEQAGLRVVSSRAMLELSWPVQNYVEVYLGQKARMPRPVVAVVAQAARLLFVRLGLLRNKAVFLATAAR